MASPNSGNVPGDKASTPFATRDGQTPNATGGAKPMSFPERATGDPAGRGPAPRNFQEGRRQGNTPPASMPAPQSPLERAAVAQTPSTPAQRANPTSIPAGGAELPALAASYRRGTGSVGSTSKPFRNLK